MGVKKCYFPIFVLNAEVSWLTKSRESDLVEHVELRSTAETVMYAAYVRSIKSYRDLPIRLNERNNIVRWAFTHPQLFSRTRDFLWPEGHTATRSKEKSFGYSIAQVNTYLLVIPIL